MTNSTKGKTNNPDGGGYHASLGLSEPYDAQITDQDNVANVRKKIDAFEDISNIIALVDQSGQYLASTSKLFFYEALLAIKQIPNLLILAMLLIPIVLLAWVGLSLSLAFFLYEHFFSLSIAALGFSGVQCLFLLAMAVVAKRIKAKASFSKTLESVQLFSKLFTHKADAGENDDK